MSVQLILFPQYFDGTNPLNTNITQFVPDGKIFSSVNNTSALTSVATPVVQTAINTASVPLNTYYRFSGNANSVVQASNNLVFVADTGIILRLSNLVVGVSYDLDINFLSNSAGVHFVQYSGVLFQSGALLTTTSGIQTVSFTANTTSDKIVLFSEGNTIMESISLIETAQSTIGIDLNNGQVICDLYEDEDIPLTLSVDEFKNVAEKVQSYSKAFNLPATKRNNKIFDNIFEITRSYDGVVFNPYKKTQCVLKQNGFILFEGFLRLIDIQDKNGEISYNVNLYSAAIALADVLKDRTFSDLDFRELEHDYNRTNIQRSWNSSGLGITYLNTGTTGFRDANSTVRYPFVDWQHNYSVHSLGQNATNNIDLPDLKSGFRPFIQIKYLIERIFADTPFTFNSSFFSSTDFEKLYMDFNFGDDLMGTGTEEDGYSYYISGINASPTNFATTSFTALELSDGGIFFIGAPVPTNYNGTTEVITATQANETYNISYSYTVKNTDTSDRTVEFRFLYNSTPLNYSGVITIPAGGYYTWTGNLQQSLGVGETLVAQFKADAGSVVRQAISSESSYTIPHTASWNWTITFAEVTSNVILQTLRGELKQWEFLKGLITMFNLVTSPDKSNPNQINIETYSDVFLNNTDSKQLNWTEKIDTEQIKLTPLTDLNKSTIFKFVEDEDDYAFNLYKGSVSGYLYGSREYQAWNEFNILEGEEEIIAEPFAATVVKPLSNLHPDFIVPSLYAYNPTDNTSEGFDNSPRIMYNNGKKTLTNFTYLIPAQNGVVGANQNEFLQFSHLSDVPTISGSRDFHFGECQLFQGVGDSVPDNLFNLYWLPYLSELYNPDTRIMSIKVNLSPNDIATFRFYDTVIIKNREYRVNKIDYKPNDLSTVEFILIP